MMVGKRQAIRRNERSRSAIVEANRAQPNMIKPGLAQVESVFCLHFVARKSVVKPHALVSPADRAQDGEREKDREKEKDALHGWLRGKNTGGHQTRPE